MTDPVDRFRDRGRDRELVVGDAGVGVRGGLGAEPDLTRLASGSRESDDGRGRLVCAMREEEDAPGVVGVGGADEETSPGGGIEIICVGNGIVACGGPPVATAPLATPELPPSMLKPSIPLICGEERTRDFPLDGRGIGVGGSDRDDGRDTGARELCII